MEQFNSTLNNLESFVRRYHFSAVIRGALLFVGFGLLYILFWIFVEHLFWLSSLGRTLVFWSLILVETVLFYRFLALPILRYFRLIKGLNDDEAAVLVGDFFPEIKDKLLNAIQLNRLEKTELVLASIEQKALEFGSIRFIRAVNLKDNLRYLKYTLAPVAILAVFYLLGNQKHIKESFGRVVNYSTEFSPPAPFVFSISNDSLRTIENTTFTLQATTIGSVRPDEVQIAVNDEFYYLKKQNNNLFEFEFSQPKKDQKFQLISGNVFSEIYTLSVVKAPQILSQNLLLNYPSYTNLKAKNVSSFSNIVVPEGTTVSWTITTSSTDTVALMSNNHSFFLEKRGDLFSFSKRIFTDFDYTLKTSNTNLRNYEVLQSKIEVIPDTPPKLNIQVKPDGQIQKGLYFYGQMTDDYGISKLLLHYAPINNKAAKNTIEITSFDKNRLDFFYAFPNSLELTPDTSYELYFEVLDNDPFPRPNRTRSTLFYYDYKSQIRIEQERLNTQQEALKNIEKELPSKNHQLTEVESIRMLSQRDKLSFNDRQNIREVLDRQEKQNRFMERFTNKMSQSLIETPNKGELSNQKKKLLERLENQRKRSEESQKQLEELRDLLNKLNKEELLERIEQLTKNSQANQRSQQQMLELTKRYYVTQKAAQLEKNLSTLANAQKQLSEQTEDQNTATRQEKLNQTFDVLSKALEELREVNNQLSKPISIPDTQSIEQSISKHQQEALSELSQKEHQNELNQEEGDYKRAQKEQQKAAQKMMQISKQMAQQMTSGGQLQLQEDITMLRQILDNLLLFSFEQEALMERFKSNVNTSSAFAKNLISQNNLKSHFEHIDDSLFVLSVRQPFISERINTDVENVYVNIDKALGLFSDNATYRAVGAQQYVITSANSLSDLLSNALSAMEMQMQMSPGEGSGEMQLPDIIMSQEALKQQAEKLSKGQDKASGENGQQGSNPSNDGDTSEGGEPQREGYSEKEGQTGGFIDSEESSQALFQLYQKQQSLRNTLSELLQQNGQKSLGKPTIDSMNKLEQMLLNQGVTNKTLAQMEALKYQYMKLDNAMKQQGLEQQRTSRFNKQELNHASDSLPLELKRFFNSKDVLNRESLPLRQQLNQKVNNYFKIKND